MVNSEEILELATLYGLIGNNKWKEFIQTSYGMTIGYTETATKILLFSEHLLKLDKDNNNNDGINYNFKSNKGEK